MKKSLLVVLAAALLVAVVSVAVVWTSDDGSRRQGALESGDAVALSWRGGWSDAVAYVPGSVVSLEGVSYVAESEKPAKPEPGCAECGWAQLASNAAQTAAASPPAGSTLTSPNGAFKVEVKDTGILLSGPNNVSVLLSADSLTAQLPKDFQVQAGLGVAVKAGSTLTLESSSNGVIKSSVLTLGCAGSGSRPVARMNDTVSNSSIVSGSSKVFAC
jgi:hypothetical protein